jgi:hypothetical protein
MRLDAITSKSRISKRRYPPASIVWVMAVTLIAVVSVFAVSQWQPPTDSSPAFFTAKPDPHEQGQPILQGKELTGEYFSHAYQIGAYKDAAKVSDRLYLMPCYCRCDRADGHKSLHSCFEGTHGAVCGVCMKEARYVYLMTQAKWSVDQIRAGIQQGKWQDIDLRKTYPEPAP